MQRRRTVLKGIAAGAAGLALPKLATAQAYPERPVTLIVPWAPGGSTDIFMRNLAELASRHLGQRIVIDNRGGAGGTLGPAQMAANAKGDGYTIAQMPITMFRYPHMTKTNFNVLTDFTWIIHLTGYTFGVVVKADAPWKTFREFLAHAKANPGKVTYSTPGNGTSLHITMEDIAKREGIEWIQVPFKGNSEANAALMGGHVMATADSTGWAELVDAGRLRLLCTWGPKRTRRWPNVPTLTDLGWPIVSNSPFGVAGPKGMDPKVVKVLHDAFRKALEDPEFQKTLDRFDQDIIYMDSDAYARFARKTYEEEGEIVRRMGLKI
jgi:tripartite-type tricarboxylate transporter receptor subunit TctC